jgi:hypothetical protein
VNNFSWKGVSLATWQEYNEIISQKWDSDMEFQCELIALWQDCAPEEVIENCSISEFNKEWEKYKGCLTPPPDKVSKFITAAGKKWELKPFTSLCLGEYVDLEHFAKDPIKNLHIMVGILWKQYREDDWGNRQEEPYEYNVAERGELFKHVDITECFGVIKSFNEWLKEIQTTYAGIFEEPEWDKIEDKELLEPNEIQQIEKEIQEDKKKQPFTWISIVWGLAGENLAHVPAVFSTSILLVWNILSMKKTLNK